MAGKQHQLIQGCREMEEGGEKRGEGEGCSGGEGGWGGRGGDWENVYVIYKRPTDAAAATAAACSALPECSNELRFLPDTPLPVPNARWQCQCIHCCLSVLFLQQYCIRKQMQGKLAARVILTPVHLLVQNHSWRSVRYHPSVVCPLSWSGISCCPLISLPSLHHL